jgi:hypothetical protein
VCARGAELAGISFLENAVNRHGGATEHNGELIQKKKFPVLFLFDLNGLRQQTQMDSVKI